jgi:hypothetical protein
MPNVCPQCGRPIGPVNQRSSQQNRAMFGIPYQMLASAMSEAWGEVVTVDAVHAMMKDKFKYLLNEYRIDGRSKLMTNLKTGVIEEIEKPPSTAKLSKYGMTQYYKALQKFGAEFFGVDIPDPREVDYKRKGKAA